MIERVKWWLTFFGLLFGVIASAAGVVFAVTHWPTQFIAGVIGTFFAVILCGAVADITNDIRNSK